MNQYILFSESQQFRQWWLWLLLLGINGLFITGIMVQVIGGYPFGDKPMSDTGLIIFSVFTLLLSLAILVFIRLETRITNDGIEVRYTPFFFRRKHYPWDSIASISVRKYDPLKEFGGWGLRGFGKNKAYNVSGRYGLQLIFTDGKKLLIGTRQHKTLENLLIALAKTRS